MDASLLEMIQKLGAPGGLTAVLGILLYVLYTVYQDLKTSQNDRIEDASKFNQALIHQMEISNATFTKVADSIEKAGSQDDKSSQHILNEIDKVRLLMHDVRDAIKNQKR